MTKDSTLKAKDRTKDLTLEAKARTKDYEFALKDNQGRRTKANGQHHCLYQTVLLTIRRELPSCVAGAEVNVSVSNDISPVVGERARSVSHHHVTYLPRDLPATRITPHEEYESSQPRERWRHAKRPTTARG